MSRTDVVSRTVSATPDEVFSAFVDPAALLRWLPPEGMSGRFDEFDARVGGRYRLVLTYLDAPSGGGKATADSDIVEARFTAIDPGVRVVQAVDFESDDPRFAGTMTMTWSTAPVDGGTRVEFRADDVPPGISKRDHEVGMTSSLRQLAAFLAR
ncbi:SRPBCC domain-containing protein [Gordonia sp. X0973]|uniref:SRPBCC domain-containing protein n=1 Tax=Gordonia sp. X0973 TaxID=2742602 RepID=UPI000F52846D|nr:SRPBCC domain-containing protein [Gordonia sp. X0973]QKT06144.1 SRPBCC domain-containing protein [Gordonia sp. X0973]